MQGVWGAQIKIITYFVTDELRLPIIQILIVDVVNYLKIVRNRRTTKGVGPSRLQNGIILLSRGLPFAHVGPSWVVFGRILPGNGPTVSKIGDRSDQKPTHSANNQRCVMYTCLVGYRAFGHKSNHVSSVFLPLEKLQNIK